MRLEEILSIERVTVSLRAQSKDEALHEVARLFQSSPGFPPENEVWRLLRDREALASTGVGSGVAIPHARVDGVARVVGALAVSAEGIPFDSVDGKPARILVALLAPAQQNAEHLKALARVSRVLRDEGVRKRLLQSEDAESALRVLLEEDRRH